MQTGVSLCNKSNDPYPISESNNPNDPVSLMKTLIL